MSRLFSILCVAFSLVVFGFSPTLASGAGFSTPATVSDWVGAVLRTDGTTEPVLLHLDGAEGTLTTQPKTAAQTVTDIQWQDSTLEFTIAGEPPLHFSGEFDAAQLTGQVEQGDQTSQWVLLPLFPVTEAALSELTGIYHFETGAALGIQTAPTYTSSGLEFFWPGLALNDYRTGSIRGLYPIAEDVFLLGSARVLGYPFLAQITILRDDQGKVSGLRWQSRDALTGELGDALEAVYTPLHYETVQYPAADDITLTGTLTLPQTPGPHPAMVVLHGSEPGRRNDFGREQTAAFLASQGFAVLTYDKRGVGDSGGIYQEYASESNLTLLANDALAGVDYLKSRSEVNAQTIGLIGYSQAGWIIPIAASSPDVNFFVILSGPLVSVGIESRYSGYTNNGDTPSNYTSEELSELLEGVSPSGFDPLPLVTELPQQGLWLWGSQDKSIPIPESVTIMESLIAGGKTNFTYQVFENADHNLQQTEQGLFDEIPYSSGYPETFYIVLADWLQTHIKK